MPIAKALNEHIAIEEIERKYIIVTRTHLAKEVQTKIKIDLLEDIIRRGRVSSALSLPKFNASKSG